MFGKVQVVRPFVICLIKQSAHFSLVTGCSIDIVFFRRYQNAFWTLGPIAFVLGPSRRRGVPCLGVSVLTPYFTLRLSGRLVTGRTGRAQKKYILRKNNIQLTPRCSFHASRQSSHLEENKKCESQNLIVYMYFKLSHIFLPPTAHTIKNSTLFTEREWEYFVNYVCLFGVCVGQKNV